MSLTEFDLIYTNVTTTNGIVAGLVNINTASEPVLACIPGIGTEKASTVVAYRLGNPGRLKSVAWLVDALGAEAAQQAGPYVTARTSVFTADVAALGHHDRGFRRERFVLDNTEGGPRVVYRQDLTQRGWALGRDVLRNLELARESRAMNPDHTISMRSLR